MEWDIHLVLLQPLVCPRELRQTALERLHFFLLAVQLKLFWVGMAG